MRTLLISTICFWLLNAVSFAQDSVRVYDVEHPLVFESSQNLWPYSFINDQGKPEGYYIDLLQLLMDELHLPYTIHLKPQREVLQDLKSHKADLTIALYMGFNNEFGLFGRQTVTKFMPCVVTPKDQPVEIASIRDLNKTGLQVSVYETSLYHHLMDDYGRTDHCIVSDDMKQSLQQVSDSQQGQVLWNETSLLWLIKHLDIDNVSIAPVTMPEEENRFLSDNQQLLNQLDEAYDHLRATGQLAPIEEKWLADYHLSTPTPLWQWIVAVLALLLLAGAVFSLLTGRRKRHDAIQKGSLLKEQLAQATADNAARIWVCDNKKHTVVLYAADGQPTGTLPFSEFVQRYDESHLTQLDKALDTIFSQQKDAHGRIIKEVALQQKVKDEKDGEEWREYCTVLSILSSDQNAKPTAVVAIEKDVTADYQQKRLDQQRSLRYWSVFYHLETAVIIFDEKGYMQDATPKACKLCQFDADKLISEHVHLNDFLQTPLPNLNDANGLHITQTYGADTINLELKNAYDDDGALLAIFVFCQKA